MGHIFIKQGSNQGSTMSPGDYYPSTLGKIASGNITALFGWSSSVTLFTPDNYMTSANIIANYAKSTNLYNKNWIDTLSGSIDTRIDTLEGYDVFDSTLYITSTSAISRFAPSGIWKKVGDSIYYSGTSKKVGIGTTNPLYPLHVLSGAAFGLQAVSPNLRGFVNIELTPDDGLGYTQALKMHANKTGISTLYGFNGTVIGANTTNIAIYGYADGATNNYGLYIEAGNALFKEDMYIEGNLSSQSISTQSISSNAITFTRFSGITDTTATELEELTDGSTTTLHDHDSTYYTETEVDSISGAIVEHARITYYPSSLGKGVSSQTLILTDWYNASGEKLSTISGSLSTKINTKQDLLDGSEYYPSSLGRGISSQVLANMKHSANSALHSFSVDLYMTSTNIITNYAKSANLYNQAWVDAFSGNIDTRLDAIVSFTPESYMTSANIISNYAASTTLIGKYSPSNQTRYGWGEVSDGGTIAHTCSSKPSWVSIAPSGANPISYAFTVDATNITVRHTSPDSETFSWRAVV